MHLMATRCIRHGGLNALKALQEKAYKWDETTTAEAARCGDVKCLQYAREHGCPWDVKTAAQAAYSGSLECLKYAHEHGCPWDARTAEFAAKKGHFECLQYAHEHGCPLSKNAAAYALSSTLDTFKCFKYLMEHGCPYDDHTLVRLVCLYDEPLIEWMFQHGHIKFTAEVWTILGHPSCNHTSDRHAAMLKMIEYCNTYNVDKGWDGRLMACAVLNKDEILMQLCKDNHAPIDKSSFELIVSRGQMSDVEPLCCDNLSESDKTSLTRLASKNGSDEMLRYLHEIKGFPLPPLAHYVRLGYADQIKSNIQCVKYLVERGSIITWFFVKDTMLYGDVEVFRWCLETPALKLNTSFFDCPFVNPTNKPLSKKMKLYLLFSQYHYFNILGVLEEAFPVKEFTHEDWRTLDIHPELRAELLHRYVYPRARKVLEWMLKVRPYAWHWYEETQKGLYKEGGKGRMHDRAKFEMDFLAKRPRTRW